MSRRKIPDLAEIRERQGKDGLTRYSYAYLRVRELFALLDYAEALEAEVARYRTAAVMAHPKYNELRALAAEPNTSNQITAEDVRKRLLSGEPQ